VKSRSKETISKHRRGGERRRRGMTIGEEYERDKDKETHERKTG
jgi:hypothetical protein